MEIKAYFDKKKEIYDNLLNILEDNESSNDDFESFVDSIKTEINNDKEEMANFVYLLTSISNNHHRYPKFNSKIEQIFISFKDEINQNISNSELFEIIKINKKLLLFLFDQRIVTIDSYIAEELKSKPDYFDFFLPELKINSKDEENYCKKRQIGENDSYLCDLIRQDSVEEFVSYANRTNLQLSQKIERSTFETNLYLIENEPSLIEYAAFFGSIQIFQYLQFNHVKLEPNLWFYVIHSKSSELIHLLEENEVKPPNDNYLKCFEESIKCHHNDIAEYIKNHFLFEMEESTKKSEKLVECIFKYSNYSFLPEILDRNDLFFYFCNYNYNKIVDLLIKQKEEYIQTKIISELLSFNSVHL